MPRHAHVLRPVLTLPVTDRDHVRGPSSASVALVEYGDYQCPYCREAYVMLKRVREQVGQRVRLVFRNFPLTAVHPDAQPAAEAAEAAAAQGKFWEMHDRLFEDVSRVRASALNGCAGELGLDVDRFARDLQSRAFAARVCTDFMSGVHSGVNGTPTFFVNGVRHDGPYDAATLTAAILARADQR